MTIIVAKSQENLCNQAGDKEAGPARRLRFLNTTRSIKLPMMREEECEGIDHALNQVKVTISPLATLVILRAPMASASVRDMLHRQTGGTATKCIVFARAGCKALTSIESPIATSGIPILACRLTAHAFRPAHCSTSLLGCFNRVRADRHLASHAADNTEMIVGKTDYPLGNTKVHNIAIFAWIKRHSGFSRFKTADDDHHGNIGH